jgi:hypothetical protein
LREKNFIIRRKTMNELAENTKEKKELAVLSPKTPKDILTERGIILSVMKTCMKQGQDYGVIPGCLLPSLYKSGAEKLLSTFRISIENPIVVDLSTEDERRYRVTIRAYSCSGLFLGSAVGECSSNEDKYKWKKAICDEEFDDTPENMRRTKWKVYKGGSKYQIKQIRTNISDVANTVLSMACKRPIVSVTRMVTAASDLFTQDIENLQDLINLGGDVENVETPMKPQPIPALESEIQEPTQKPKMEAIMTVPQAKEASEGSTINVKGILINIAHLSPKGIPLTEYAIAENYDQIDSGIVIKNWKRDSEGFSPGDEILASQVVITVYRGLKQYTARGISKNV